MMGSSIVTLALFIVAVIVVIQAIRVVPQQHALVVERLGRFHAVLAPGLNFVIPFVDRVAYRHDLRWLAWGKQPHAGETYRFPRRLGSRENIAVKLANRLFFEYAVTRLAFSRISDVSSDFHKGPPYNAAEI